jgi:hypothetical protein
MNNSPFTIRSLQWKGWMIPVLLLLALAAASEGCGGRPMPTAVAVTPAYTSSPTVVLIAPTRMPPTNTPIPSSTPSPSLIPSPIWTPLPTIPSESIPDTAAEWITTNKGCAYPCVWGIMPGKTDWMTARSILEQINPQFSAPRSLDSKLGVIQDIRYPLPDNWAYSSEGYIEFLLDDNLIQSIETPNDLSISKILTRYGLPGEVWISHTQFLQYTYYIVSFFYPDQGILALYAIELFNLDIDQICPYRFSETLKLIDGYNKLHIIDHRIYPVILWDPRNKKTFQEVINMWFSDKFYNGPYRTINQATELTGEQFYETYRDPSAKQCMKVKPVE